MMTAMTMVEVDIEAVAKAYAGVIGEPPSVPLGDDARAWRAFHDEVTRYVTRALDFEKMDAVEHKRVEDLDAIGTRVATLGRYFASQTSRVEDGLGARASLGVPRMYGETVMEAFNLKLKELSRAFKVVRGDVKHLQWSPPSKFERRTIKYWVDERDVVPLQVALLKHLPILEFHGDDADANQDNSLITSVYLENASFEAYHARLHREQGATLVRCRWYGGGDPVNVFLERKTHHESWSTEKSVKERCRVTRDDAVMLVSGSKPTNIAGDENLAREIYEREIDARRMSACLMTRYRRVAFQRDESNEIRISLDTELRWQDVRTLGSCAIARPLDDSRAHVFRYAVLEIKLAYADEAPPGWLDAIVRSFDVVEVYKFSKYQHGCALLYPNALQKFPHWYGCDAVVVNVPKAQQHDVDMGERSESSSSFNELVRAAVATIKTCRRSDPKSVDASTTVMRGDAPSRLRHVPVKVEPKTFFANERTLLQWLSMSILLLFLALGLLSMERGAAAVIPSTAPTGTSFSTLPSAICGLILAPISILFMLYALWTYIIRARRIARREPSARYDDMYGPVALVALLVIIAIATVTLTSASIDWRNM